MRKTFGFLVLLAGLTAMPGMTPRAEADHNSYRYNRHPYSHRLSAWEIVRRDPCRYAEYRDYARRHQNPNKRQRFIERLAREGCEYQRRYGRYDYRDRRWWDRYSYNR